MSGVYYLPINHVLYAYLEITNIFKEYRYDNVWDELTFSIEEKFYEYFGDMSTVITCATVLNTIIKLKGVKSILVDILKKYR